LFSPSWQPIASALSVHELLATSKMAFSLDFVLCDFFLFSELKMMIKGRRFHAITMIQTKVEDGLDFQTVNIMKCFEWWHVC
jgi:hypothetical protein